jgi:hypothetical protein
MTDIATGWTVNRSVRNKAARWVVEAIEEATRRFPFPILGIDSDNGSEFINAHLFQYCAERKITCNRSRTGNKNDGAHVEQKNRTHVRQLVGYLRFDSPDELELLNRIWAQRKLATKQRHGAKVTKRYDLARTPFTRALSHPGVTDLERERMNNAFGELHMAALNDQIQSLLVQLEHYSLTKGLALLRRVNRSFNCPLHSEVLDEAMNLASRKI